MLKNIIVLTSLIAATFAACPNIVSRAEWGARPPNSISYQSVPVPYVVIHHSASGGCTSQSSCSSLVRSFQNYHMDSNGWADIGYSFLVGEDGNAYEGRGWDRVGAHAPGYNSQSIGICIIGTFTSSVPNTSAQNAAKNLISCGVSNGKIRSAYSLIGHRQATSTACPGDALYNLIKSWDNYNPNP
uniref:Peptidoglycan-recognition protein n=1 Tax=Artemia sinica TaxID=112780 RepID=A0A0G3BE90_9CRUS|nr:peptidoglycan-recognition protein-sc2 precursor-like protein [Artemia sinica]